MSDIHDQLRSISAKLDTITDRQAFISEKQATLIERVDNSLRLFDKHLEDDKEIADRVSLLEKNEAKLTGKIAGVTVASMVAGYFINTGLKLLGK